MSLFLNVRANPLVILYGAIAWCILSFDNAFVSFAYSFANSMIDCKRV